jgi:protein-ribulosamine 3-kinase
MDHEAMGVYEDLLRDLTQHKNLAVTAIHRLGGGSINTCTRVETTAGYFFVKENDAKKYPGIFDAEIRGLEYLSASKTFVVPRVIGKREVRDRNTIYLALEWLNRETSRRSWYDAGVLLANLHKNTSADFGLDHDNYIGSLPQSNKKHTGWTEFFTLERILPQIRLARDAGRIDPALTGKAEKFCHQLDSIFPKENPALLHGDLWSGNFFFSNNGPAVFDPAVYFGHREMDLAMTKLFGGFDADFYAGYENEFPLEKKWKARTEFCNLYPLLVHVNLFGGGYVEDVRAVLRNF